MYYIVHIVYIRRHKCRQRDDDSDADDVDDDDNDNGNDISHNGLVGFRNRAHMRDLNWF